MKKILFLLTYSVLVLASCAVIQSGANDTPSAAALAKLAAILDARGDDLKARDVSRHPRETIEFIGLKPGMRVAEVLPGGTWYTQILAQYVGREGAIYGVNYADDMWSMFGFFNEKMIAERIASNAKFPEKIASIAGEGMTAEGFALNNVPKRLYGSLDAVVMIRALHNLNRFEEKAGTRSQALKEVHALLKPGGIVGVVQHRAPADADDIWANGSNGYLKQSAVVDMFEAAGFELIASSEINANPKDLPTADDYVWRLPPSLRTAPEKKAAMRAIGESDRMTLKFRKE